jgi:hypothetical protein
MMRGLLPLSPSFTMNATATDGASPGWIGDLNSKKHPAPVPRRGPEAEVLHI